MNILLQDSIDQFIFSQQSQSRDITAIEQCMSLFAEYLLHYSDLFQESWLDEEEGDLKEWEASLGQHMEQLLDEDVEDVYELGGLRLEAIQMEHISDFVGWFLLRETQMNSISIETCIQALQAWLLFTEKQGWMPKEQYSALFSGLSLLAPESIRAAKVASLLLHFVRMGGGVSPRLREQRFQRFVEGHARVCNILEQTVSFKFDNEEEMIEPVVIPKEIIAYMQEGDVIDIELGLRGDIWIIVDLGPIYPRYVYMEADLFDVPEKIV